MVIYHKDARTPKGNVFCVVVTWWLSPKLGANIRPRENCLQHPAADGQGFIRDHLAETRVVTRVNVADFQAACDGQSGMKQAAQDTGEWTMDHGRWTKVRGQLSIVDLCDNLTFFNVLTNIYMSYKYPIAGGEQEARRVAIGLTSIRVRAAAPEDAPERVTAAGLDHGLAVHASLESRAETDVQGGRVPDGFRRTLSHTPVHDDGGMKEFGGGAAGVHQQRDLLFAESAENAQGIAGIVHSPGDDALDADFAGIDCLGK
jgi:hypothetical protein